MEGCSLILNKKRTVYIEKLMNSYILRTRKNIHTLHSDFLFPRSQKHLKHLKHLKRALRVNKKPGRAEKKPDDAINSLYSAEMRLLWSSMEKHHIRTSCSHCALLPRLFCLNDI